MSEVVIHAEELGKRYRLGARVPYRSLREALSASFRAPHKLLRRPRAERFWALKDVNLEVHRGEVLGVIGRNGAGKTTLLKILSRITRPTTGAAEIRGRVGSLLEVGTGFHPELTGRENIYLSGAILGMAKKEIVRKFDEIVAFAEIEQFLDTAVKHYSSGMFVRLAFAVAAHLEPDILLVDEVLAVGDAAFQKKCMGKMGGVIRGARTIIFVSHNLGAIRNLCTRALWIDNGNVRLAGTVGECVDAYTASLQEGSRSGAGAFDLVNFRERSGNGKVRFRRIRLVGHDGIERNELEFGEPFVMEFEINCCETVPPCFVGWAVLSSDGVSLLGSHHSDSGELRSLRAGQTYRLRCFVQPNLLKPGLYGVQVAASDYATWESYDWIHSIGQFSVVPGSGKFGRLPDNRPAFIQPRFEWKWQ